MCANHIGWWLSSARSACKPLTHDKHQPITEERPSGAHSPRARDNRFSPSLRVKPLVTRAIPYSTDALNFRRFSLKSLGGTRARADNPGWQGDKGETTPAQGDKIALTDRGGRRADWGDESCLEIFQVITQKHGRERAFKSARAYVRRYRGFSLI